jgi:hypothetical protein
MASKRLSVIVTNKLGDDLKEDARKQTKLRRETLDDNGCPGLPPKTRITISMRAAEILSEHFQKKTKRQK